MDVTGGQKQLDFNRAAKLRILEQATIPELPPERRTKRIRNQGTLKAILKALESFQREGASSFPSIPTLATHTGFSVRTIQRGLRTLAARSLISIESRIRPNGSTSSNSYTIDIVKLMDGRETPTTDSQDTSGQEIRSGQTNAATPPGGGVKLSGGGVILTGGGVILTGGGVILTGGGCHPDTPIKHQPKRPLKRNVHVAEVSSREEGGKESADRGSTNEARRKRDSRAKTHWGRHAPLTRADLTNGAIVETLYQFALARGWGDLRETEADRLKFYALARFCGHKATDQANAGRYLTYCLKNQLWGNIREEDDEAARRLFVRQRSEERQQARAADERGDEIARVAAPLFAVPPEDQQPDRRAELQRRAQLERTKRPWA